MPLLAISASVLAAALWGRWAAWRLLPGANGADRLVAGLLAGTTVFLAGPLWAGIVSGRITPGVVAAGQAILAAAAGWLLSRAGENPEAPPWRERARLFLRRGGWAWGLVLLWSAAWAAPGWWMLPRAADAVEYHSTQPLQWLATGEFRLSTKGPLDLAAASPRGETQPNLKALAVVQLAWVRGDLRGAGLVQAWFLLLWLAAIRAIARRFGVAEGWAALAAAAIAGTTDVMLQSTELYADIQAAAAIALVLWGIVLLADDGARRGRIGAFALAAGHVATAKASLLLAGAGLGMLALAVIAVKTGASQRVRRVALAAALSLGAVAALGGPWYAHGIRAHGNPVHPIRVELGGRVLLAGSVDAGINREMLGSVYGITVAEAYRRSLLETVGLTQTAYRFQGLGPAWAGLMAPAVLLALAMVWEDRAARRRWTLLLAALGAVIAGVPDLWWPRFALTTGTVGAVALALVAARGGPLARTWIAVAVVAAALWNGWRAVPSLVLQRREPVLAFYPLVTGDMAPQLRERVPGLVVATDLAAGLGPEAVVAYLPATHAAPVFAGKAQALAMPGMRDLGGADAWIAALRTSPATHFLAKEGTAELKALRERRREFAAEPLPGLLPRGHVWDPAMPRGDTLFRILRGEAAK